MIINKIRNLCDKEKITLKSLAEKVGMSETGFHQMINRNSMKVATLEAIAKEFNVSPAYFWQSDLEVSKSVDKVFSALRKVVEQNM